MHPLPSWDPNPNRAPPIRAQINPARQIIPFSDHNFENDTMMTTPKKARMEPENGTRRL
ncbi:MAG: hypothetical protein PHD61_00110 [Bacteroidales bacterium]|nr:hypothetical protein [Lentimicrobiaceae bacterium]MDD5693696.1 hypothetical protein [Bacteroidales bacterium]